jgi:hypothetical protein
MARVADVSGRSLAPFVESAVAPGSVVMARRHRGLLFYRLLEQAVATDHEDELRRRGLRS